MTAEQKAQITQLSNKRKGCNPYSGEGYKQYEDPDLGYDTGEYVVPWTIGANSTEKRVMIIGQDWCSEGTLTKARERAKEDLRQYGRILNLPTNVNLEKKLSKYLGISFAETWATEVFVWVKPKNISAPISLRKLTYSAKHFALPEIEIVRPKVAIVLGGPAFRALRKAANISGKVARTVDKLVPFCYEGVKIMPVYHTGSFSNVVKCEHKKERWQRVVEMLETDDCTICDRCETCVRS